MTFSRGYRVGRSGSHRSASPFSSTMYVLAGVVVFTVSLLLVSSARDVRNVLAVGYLVQILAYVALNQFRHNLALIRLLQPSMISMIYIGLNFAVGAWAFNSGNVVNMLGGDNYGFWRNLQQVYFVSSSCFLALYLLSLRNLGLPQSDIPLSVQEGGRRPPIAMGVAILFVCLAASTFLTFSVLTQLKTVLAAGLLYLLFAHNVKYKWIFTLFIIVILASTSAHSKREAIFFIPAISLLVLSYYPAKKITFKKMVLGTVAVVFAGILILAMSIIRGYGGFDPTGITDAALYIPQYLEMQHSVGLIMNNFELSYIFLHAHNCISFALKSTKELAHGETYLRAFLIWPIGDLLNYKPASIIDQYTLTFFPSFRAVGGSFGVTSLGEAVWNFGLLAPLAVVPIYFALDSFFSRLVILIRGGSAWSTIFALNAFQFSLYFTRGSGLDLMLIYIIFSLVSGFLVSVFLSMLNLDINVRAVPKRRLQYVRGRCS